MTLPSAASIVLLFGIASLVVPTLLALARQHWSTESGAHGPILLATAVWLFWRNREEIRAHARPLRSSAWIVLLAPLLAMYAFAAVFDILSVRTLTLYLMLVLLAVGHWGWAVARLLWFPLTYMAFLIAPPGSLLADATLPVKLWISSGSVELLYALGYPVAQAGAVIHIDQYELTVEAACAGLGSLVSLSALGLLYVHLRWNAGVARSILLLMLVFPAAVLTNFVRVIMLVLMTYHLGHDVAQGFAHDAAGLLMFAVGMLCMLSSDWVIQQLSSRMRVRA